MRKYLHIIWAGFVLVAGVLLVFESVGDLNAAKSGIELFKAFFWLFIGALAINSARDDFNKWT